MKMPVIEAQHMGYQPVMSFVEDDEDDTERKVQRFRELCEYGQVNKWVPVPKLFLASERKK